MYTSNARHGFKAQNAQHGCKAQPATGCRTALLMVATLFPFSLRAALPTPVAPSTAPAAGDWIALIQGYIKDGGLVLGLAIAVLGFLWIAYLGFAKFNEARQGKAEWAEVGVLGIVGAIVLTFASYLLSEAAGVI